MTRCEIISSYECSKCPNISDDSDSQERFKNIVYLNITSASIADIFSNARLTEDNFLKRCFQCGIHRRKQNWLILTQNSYYHFAKS